MRKSIEDFVLCVFTFSFITFFYPHTTFAQLLINEFHPRTDEWVEFYNSGENTVNLSGYYFDDDTDFNSDSGTSYKKLLAGTLNPSDKCYLSLSSFLNDSGDSPSLFDSSGDLNDTYSYSGSVSGKTYSRVPDGGSWLSDQTPTKTSVDCLSLVISTTSSPSPTPISTPTPSTSTCIVNKAKDGNGTELYNIKIYIDGNYTGNYTPETYTFCDGCTCGSNKVACGFGGHTFLFERSGYISTNETKNIESGNTYTLSPVLSLSASTSSATTSPASTATPTPSASPKTSSSPKPTTEKKDSNQVSGQEQVLGLRNELNKEQDLESQNDEVAKNIPIAGVVFLAGGIITLGASAFVFIRKSGVKYKDEIDGQ